MTAIRGLDYKSMILEHLWLKEDGRDGLRVMADLFNISYAALRRHALALKSEGFICVVETGQVKTKRDSVTDMLSTDCEINAASRRKYQVVREENPWIGRTCDQWALTEKGFERMMHS